MKMVSTNVRISDEMLEEISKAADISGTAQADVIRLAIKLGMASLAKIGFNPDAVVQARVDELELQDKGKPSTLPRPRDLKPNTGKKFRA